MKNRWNICMVVLGFLCFAVPATAQKGASYNGDALAELIARPKDSPEIKAMLESFQCETGNGVTYKCQNGTEMEFKNGVLEQIYFYFNSFLHGSYTGTLPHKLAFGMSPDQVKALLGKPSVAYNNTGYCEFRLAKYNLSCWFENGKLNQMIMGRIE